MRTTFVPTPHQNAGFDEDASWVLLPDDGERRVHLLNGSTMSLHVIDPSVVKAVPVQIQNRGGNHAG